MTNEELIALGQKNFEKLKLLYQDGNKVIPFLGAGSSVTPGLPDWKDLLVNMIEAFTLNKEEFQDMLDKKEFSKVASLIYSKIQEGQYKEYLSKALKPTKDDFSGIHIRLVRRFNIILTTNFDDILDKAAEEEEYEISKQILPYFSLSDIFTKRTYVYLHGHIETGNLIFRNEDYSLFYENDGTDYVSDLYELMKLFIKETHLIFIGFSFNDEHFYDMYLKIKNVDLYEARKRKEKHYSLDPASQKDHFVFVSLSDDAQRNKDLVGRYEKLKILPIFYEVDQHAEIGRYIRQLSIQKDILVKEQPGEEVLDG